MAQRTLVDEKTGELYNIASMVGFGNFGKVYKAVRERDGQILAYKDVAMNERNDVPCSYLREVAALKKLNSPHIPKLHGTLKTVVTVGLFMDYMPFTLRHLISRKYNFTDSHVLSIASQLISGVACIHAHGMVHRDLKTKHILLDCSGNLKIADFGLAREECTNMTNKAMTLHYRAPELLLGDTGYTNKVDAWSIGCILLEIYSGKPIFGAKNEVEQCKLILSTLGRSMEKYPWDDLFRVELYPGTDEWDKLFDRNFGHLAQNSTISQLKEMLQVDPRRRLSVKNASKLQLIANAQGLRCEMDSKEAYLTKYE